MENYKKIIKRNLDIIAKSEKTFRDLYNVIFLHRDLIAYERLVNFDVEAVTYLNHDLEIRAFAAYLKQTYPHELGSYIAIDLPNSPNFLIAFWGVLMSGNKPYLVNSFYPPELRIKLLKRLNIKLIISDNTDYDDFSPIDIDNFDKNCRKIAENHWENEFIISSSLTGMEAKMCVFDGEAVVNQILNSQDILSVNNWFLHDYNKRIKVAMILPLFHIFGIMVCYFWFAFYGRTMVFLRDNSPDTIRGVINRHKITHIFAPPILYHKLYKGIMNAVAQEGEKLQSKFQRGIKIAFALQNVLPRLGVIISRRLFREVLAASFGTSPRFMISGGAHINSEALKTINCIGYPLFNGYGTTETAILSVNLAKKISERVNGSIGSPFKSVSYSFDEDSALTVSGSTLCKKIISLNSEENDIKSIKTNDIIKIENDNYFIVGRKSDLYIGENGENISPDIIQNALSVKKANRFCVLELEGKLCIVLEYNEKMPDAIIAKEISAIRESLTSVTYGNYVEDIFITKHLIASPNAIKVSRAILRHKIKQGEVTLISYKSLKSETETRDCEADDSTMLMIKQLFKSASETKSEVQSNSNFFFDLGGSSLEYIVLINEIESIFDIQINLEKNQNLHTPDCFYAYIMGEIV